MNRQVLPGLRGDVVERPEAVVRRLPRDDQERPDRGRLRHVDPRRAGSDRARAGGRAPFHRIGWDRAGRDATERVVARRVFVGRVVVVGRRGEVSIPDRRVTNRTGDPARSEASDHVRPPAKLFERDEQRLIGQVGGDGDVFKAAVDEGIDRFVAADLRGVEPLLERLLRGDGVEVKRHPARFGQRGLRRRSGRGRFGGRRRVRRRSRIVSSVARIVDHSSNTVSESRETKDVSSRVYLRRISVVRPRGQILRECTQDDIASFPARHLR